ncbi:LysR substrate-binding domain-containing protein [Serratia ficaria]|uniref:Gcv operon activator n=1 Tax=Serratia ficaria TaxID=61651 RepID=A0A240BMC6_SERFI|nr:LysR substrate-binding domain-containing protein [Serratia ficaria]MEE4483624.1 LysR substrate-binding domain-containing protein [Serratia ficaria]REF45767.1 LysR family glycine cleavage system transcriptional activator [Serratia ficaria]CAI0816625.1 Gcv operon activator [Serratia ficaria]CAI0850854.1 Gcv operon activator [Serratia ficaria]CAI0862878.1 Gcv operon activator [Serratia ficaria]
MPMTLPSLDVLKTFVAVAQRLNFTHAAQALHLTQGAVSRQILGLEQRLGYPLFIRRARGLTLTPQGAMLLAPVQQALGQLDEALERVGAQPGTLRIKCPTCAMRWVLPRIIRLQNERPEMHIELTASVSHGLDFGAEHFDAAVAFGRPPGKKLTAHHLFDEILTPVCTPSYLPDLSRPPLPADLADKTLLHPTRDRRDWLMWLKAAGSDALPSGKAQHFDTLDLAMSAALQGFGIAIGDLCLLEEDIQAQRIVTPFPLSVVSGAAYYLVYPERAVLPPTLAALVSFLGDEAANSRAWQRKTLSVACNAL